MKNKIYCLGKQRLHQILEFEICSFLNLLSDWSIQKFWKITLQYFWINQSEKREGKFKIEKWSNFGPRYCQIGTKIGTSNIRIVIHMVKRVSERLNRKIGDGVTGPSKYSPLLLEEENLNSSFQLVIFYLVDHKFHNFCWYLK